MSAPKPRVILRRCDRYDLDRVERIIGECLTDLGTELRDPVFIKPNVVSANRRYIHASYTHPTVVEGMVRVLQQRGSRDITVGESGGYGIPSRLFFRESGYFDMAARTGVPVVDLNEHPSDALPLARGKWHRSMEVSRFLQRAQCKIWMPKLKYHIFASVTHALKLNVGILLHKERMLFHDHRIHEKIVDLLEVGYPDVVIGDAIDITYGFESAPYPTHLGVLVAADHPLAADVVAAHLLGYEAGEVRHLREAARRGYGSLDLADISIEGDADLEALRAAPKGQPRLFQHLRELETPIRFFAGTAPDTDTVCDGGCEAAVKGALGTIEKRRPGSLARARPGAIVTGQYRGDVVCPGGAVLLVGSCTRVDGELRARKIVRVRGCPMGARELFVVVPWHFGLSSPMLDLRDASLFVWTSLLKLAAGLWHRVVAPRLPGRRRPSLAAPASDERSRPDDGGLHPGSGASG